MPKTRNKFECSHWGYGQFCHTCMQLRTGELVEDSGGKLQRNPKWISDSKIVAYIKTKMPDETFKGLSKQRIIDFYCKKRKTTISNVRNTLQERGK